MQRQFSAAALLVTFALLGSACEPLPNPQPSPSPSASPSPTPTSTPSPSSSATPSPVPSAGPSQVPPVSAYPLKRNIITTYFWAGELAGDPNGGISNVPSAWDEEWSTHFGGYDDPDHRDGWFPRGFTPKENPFYVAIPYNDFENGRRKAEVSRVVPWANSQTWGARDSMIKNRWVRIIKNGVVCYGQIEDVGPFLENDKDYVFGNQPPKNNQLEKAGFDVSPAIRDYLRLGDVDRVDWQFVDDHEVPPGPWKQIVTTSQISW